MNLQSWILLILIIALAVFAIYRGRRRRKQGKGCCSGCSGCSGTIPSKMSSLPDEHDVSVSNNKKSIVFISFMFLQCKIIQYF